MYTTEKHVVCKEVGLTLAMVGVQSRHLH